MFCKLTLIRVSRTKDGRFSVAISLNYYDRQAIFSVDRKLAANADTRVLGGNNNNVPLLPGGIFLNADPSFIIGIDPTQLITGYAGTRAFSVTGGDGFNFRLYTPAIPAQEKFFGYGAFSYKLFNDNRAILYGDLMYGDSRQYNGYGPSYLLPLTSDNIGAAVGNSPFNPFGTANPTNPATLNSPGYTTLEGGNRLATFDSKYYRFEGGLKGEFNFRSDILASLNYDVGAVYEEFNLTTGYSGDTRFSAILAQYLPFDANSQALLATLVSGNALANALRLNQQFGGTFNPFLGLQAPRIGTAPTFVDGAPTGLTQPYDNVAAIRRALYSANSVSLNQATLVDLRVGGTLLPRLAQGGFAFIVGAEYRTESQGHEAARVMAVNPTTGLSDQSGLFADVDSNYNRRTYSIFGELSLPVITPAMKVPLVYGLDFTAAFRWEQYENSGRDPTVVNPVSGLVSGPVLNIPGNNGGAPRFTVRWQPYQDLLIRASYGQSFAQPSFGQLFQPNIQDFPVIFDPLTRLTQQPRGGVFERGNVNLLPEKSDTYTAGLVFAPKQIKGFSLTIDFYQINTRNVIITPPSQAQVLATINGRAGGGPNAPFSITQQQADAGVFGVYRVPGAVGDARFPAQINAGYGNAGSRFVEGMELTAVQNLPTKAFGTFTLTLGYNHFFYFNVDVGAGFGPTRFAGGNFASLPLTPGAVPFNKGYFRAEWTYQNFYFGATVNYVGDYLNDGAFLANGANFQVNSSVSNPSYFYHRYSGAYTTLDLQVSYSFKPPKSAVPPTSSAAKEVRTQVAANGAISGNFWQKLLWGTTIRIGVNNLFDRSPPFDAGTFNDNYDTSTYSIRNRFLYVGINKKF